jgi:hypothetical protein
LGSVELFSITFFVFDAKFLQQTFEIWSKSARLLSKINLLKGNSSILNVHNFAKNISHAPFEQAFEPIYMV